MRRWLLFVVAVATPIASAWGCTGDECLRNSDCPSAYLCGAGTCVLREMPDAGGEAGETSLASSGAMSGSGGVSGAGAASGSSGSGGVAGRASQGGSAGSAGESGAGGMGGDGGASGAAGDGGAPAVIVVLGGSAGSLPIAIAGAGGG